MLQHLLAPGTVHCSVKTVCLETVALDSSIYFKHFPFYLLVTILLAVWPDCLYCCHCITSCLLQGINVNFPPNKLKQGFGEHAVFVLDHLVDAALKSTNFAWKK